jgi:hypothetical protein
MPTSTARRAGSRALKGAASAFLALLSTGCVGGPEASQGFQPVRFAVIGAPRLGGDLLAEDMLLEAVTVLSLEPDLDFCLVPGPLLAGNVDDLEAARDALVGALGSLASPVYTAWGPGDGPELELLEALEQGLFEHPGQLSYAGKVVRGVQPVVLDATGAPPDDLAPRANLLRVAVSGGQAGSGVGSLRVRAGAELGLQADSAGAELVVPSLAEPPHLYGVCTWDGRELSVAWHALEGEQAPPAPPPIQLSSD